MNDYQTTLYHDLIDLVENTETFFYTDTNVNDTWYRFFNYRLTQYADFCKPRALDTRGTMFEISENGENATVIRLASHPFQKFFNLFENESTSNLDMKNIVSIAEKADGSLISTYLHHDKVRVKTKGSLQSDQAIDAALFLERDENSGFYDEIHELETMGYTIICEYCAPNNRIILTYSTANLIVLGIRNRDDGSYLPADSLDILKYPEIIKRWCGLVQGIDDFGKLIEDVPTMEHIEGYVVEMADGMRFKVKTGWYLVRHRCIDTILCPRHLYAAVLEEATDDIRAMFHADPEMVTLINTMEKYVGVKHAKLMADVENFYTKNKGLSRKEYAIHGLQVLPKPAFILAMKKYLGEPFSYVEKMKSLWDAAALDEWKKLV